MSDNAEHAVLDAAANHDTQTLLELLKTNYANVQDSITEYTPLHAAIAACQTLSVGGRDFEEVKDTQFLTTEYLAKPIETVELLLRHGAIWDDLDVNGDTPGCIAKWLGLPQIYDLMVDAGVRAEILLSRLEQFGSLKIDEKKQIDTSAVSSGHCTDDDSDDDTPGDTNASYLSSDIRINSSNIVDQEGNAVMMEWESTIMRLSAEALLPTHGLRILNVGYGMGIIDRIFQTKEPSSHHIIEAHPAVLQKMAADSWDTETNVTIHSGKWQEICPKLEEERMKFDAIYFDTFGESYDDFKDFLNCVSRLLEDGGGKKGKSGKFSFFNGAGADRQICYDVYTKVWLEPFYVSG